MVFRWVPAGELRVQVPEAETTSWQTVKIERGFWMGEREVTVRQFRRFARATAYMTEAEKSGARWTWRQPGFRQSGKHPVVFITFADAEAYCQWAGTVLPTETEWLHACRAGTSTRYYWGDQLDPSFVWYRGNTHGTGTRAVGRTQPNGWGLYDTVGNAREFCRIEPRGWVPRGSGWARCDKYWTRQGSLAKELVAEGVEPVLHRWEPEKLLPYPTDDDHGFRCVRHVATSTPIGLTKQESAARL